MPVKSRDLPRLQTIRVGFVRLPILGKFVALWMLKKMFPVFFLRRHAYIVAKSGSGKSELIKILFLVLKCRLRSWRTRAITSRSVIILDPHGDVAQECARQRFVAQDFRASRQQKLAPDTVLISPTLASGFIPSLNPFDLQGKNFSQKQIEVMAQNLTAAFSAMIGRDGAHLSSQMRTILTPLFTVLLILSRDGSHPPTFFDLERFLDDTRNGDLVAFAQDKIENTGLRKFFRHLYHRPRFQLTKFALQSRLSGLLNLSFFVDMLCQKRSTWDLESMMNSGKSIIIDANKSELGEQVSEIYGRMITALVQSYAFRRKQQGKRALTFFVIDEAASFVSDDIKTILNEARKFGVHLTLVNQLVKQGGISKEFHDTIMGNTGTKVIGNAGSATKKAMSVEFECPVQLLEQLSVGQFVVKHDNGNPPRKVIIPPFWIGNRSTMSDAQWEQVKADLLARYYRNINEGHIDARSQLREEISASKVPNFGKVGAVTSPRPVV